MRDQEQQWPTPLRHGRQQGLDERRERRIVARELGIVEQDHGGHPAPGRTAEQLLEIAYELFNERCASLPDAARGIGNLGVFTPLVVDALELEPDLADLLDQPQERHQVDDGVSGDRSADLGELHEPLTLSLLAVERLEMRREELLDVPGQRSGRHPVPLAGIGEPDPPPEEPHGGGRVPTAFGGVHLKVVVIR